MQYFGGKQRIAKELITFLRPHQSGRDFYEPFVGGCNIIPFMSGHKFASDANDYIISMYLALQQGWLPPMSLSPEEYEYVKTHRNENKALTGFVGIGCSYSGKWFGGYAKNNTPRNYCRNAYNGLRKLQPLIADIQFNWISYQELRPKNALVYCDPPYSSTTQYGATGYFDSGRFWEIMRYWSINNLVFISEYTAPDDFKCVWHKQTKLDIRNKNNEKESRTEKLFQWAGRS